MKRITLIIVLALLSLSCSNRAKISSNSLTDKNLNYKISGISFSYPDDWEVTDGVDEEHSVYVNLLKKGDNSSGLVAFTLFREAEFEPAEYINYIEQLYLEEEYFENVNFEKAKGKNYGYYNGIASSYTFVALGIPHQGTIYVIQKGTQLMTIMEQEAIEDTKDNKKGFETLRETFKF